MKRYGLSSLGFLGFVAALFVILPTGSACLDSSQSSRDQEEKDSNSKSKQKIAGTPSDKELMNRDHRFHELLTDFERLKAIWKQQPDNRAALKRCVTDVQDRLAALRESLKTVDSAPSQDKPEPPAKTPTPIATVKPGRTRPPSGPAQPSKTPTPDKEIAKREKATLEKLSPAGPEKTPLETRTLRHVSDDWVKEKCRDMEKELKKLSTLLDRSPVDRKAMEELLRRLQKTVSAFDDPPRESPKPARGKTNGDDRRRKANEKPHPPKKQRSG